MDAALVAAATISGADDNSPPPDRLLSAWMTKKAAGLKRNMKRFFELYSDGTIRYFAAVDPEGIACDEKGVIRVFVDTKFQAEGEVLTLSSLAKNGLKSKEWTLTAESAEVATQWAEKIKSVQTSLSGTSDDYRRAAEAKKSAQSTTMHKLGTKVATSATQATTIMRSFGFSGSVKVSGMLLGLSVSMSVEVGIEEGEGSVLDARRSVYVEPPEEEEEEEDDDDEVNAVTADEANEDVDESVPDSPQKEGRFKRSLKKAINSSMKKVKVLAFHMRRSNLTGTIGVGVSLTVFGFGVELEFEIALESAITELEFEQLQKEMDAKNTK